jgi:hypothetical protein
MNCRAILCVLAVFLAPATAAAQLVNENLLVAIPPGYKIEFQDKKNNMQMTEMVPAGQTVNDWTEMVTVQIFFGLKVAPELFRKRIENGWFEACFDGQSEPLPTALENGYPSLIWVLSCPRNPKTGKPELTWFKAVAGNDSFYVVQKAFKFAPSQEETTRWVAYLKSATVCDSRKAEHPCPRARK